jgi:hypothetical protein
MWGLLSSHPFMQMPGEILEHRQVFRRRADRDRRLRSDTGRQLSYNLHMNGLDAVACHMHRAARAPRRGLVCCPAGLAGDGAADRIFPTWTISVTRIANWAVRTEGVVLMRSRYVFTRG